MTSGGFDMGVWNGLPMGEDLHDSFMNYQRRVIQELDVLSTEFGFEPLDANRPVDANADYLAERVSAMLTSTEAEREERPTA